MGGLILHLLQPPAATAAASSDSTPSIPTAAAAAATAIAAPPAALAATPAAASQAASPPASRTYPVAFRLLAIRAATMALQAATHAHATPAPNAVEAAASGRGAASGAAAHGPMDGRTDGPAAGAAGAAGSVRRSEGSTVPFVAWVGHELGACAVRGGGGGGGGGGAEMGRKLTMLLRCVLPLMEDECNEVRLAALGTLVALLRCPAAATLASGLLGLVLQQALAQLHVLGSSHEAAANGRSAPLAASDESAARTALLQLIGVAAPAALAALSSHAQPEAS